MLSIGSSLVNDSNSMPFKIDFVSNFTIIESPTKLEIIPTSKLTISTKQNFEFFSINFYRSKTESQGMKMCWTVFLI